MSGSSGKQWNVIGAAVVVFGLTAIAALVLPVFYAVRHMPSYKPWDSMDHARVIMQGVIAYGDTNNGHYSGLTSNGLVIDTSVEFRYWVMLDTNFIHGNHIISPLETKTEWAAGPLTNDNYSYAMLKLDGDVTEKLNAGRGDEWRLTDNAQAIMISDRNTGTDAHSDVQSVHTQSPGSWEGVVGRNDGSASFKTTHQLDTRYGKNGTLNIDDNIFAPAGTDDAYMIYTGD